MISSERNWSQRSSAALWAIGLGWLFPMLALAQLAGTALSGGPRTVTLITGDQVLIPTADEKSVIVRPRAGRENIIFETRYEYSEADRKEHVYVTPSDASELIGAGKLDPQLFDITELLDSHYDDASRKTVPLIVTYERTRAHTFSARSAALARTTITHRLNSVNGESLSAPKQDIGNLWDMLADVGVDGRTKLAAPAASVRKIWLDQVSHLLLDRSVVQIGAPAVWASGYTGAGVTVAVVDSGIDRTHPDLASQVIAERSFVSDRDPDVTDRFGHGTHIASIIAGTGATSGGRYRGVAPDARLISAKACVRDDCYASAEIAAFEWAVAEMGVRIVSMSVGGVDTPDIDPKEEAVNRLTAQYGALFIISAGNNGGAGSVKSPSTADAALSVAAVDRNDQIAEFSNRGPRLADFGVKPDISAPGVGIVAARAAGTGIGSVVDDFYTAVNGTSMATPHVTGAAVLLKQRHPEWSPAQLKAALMGSARFSPTTAVVDQGAGRLDIAAAFTASVIADPASLSLGRARFPHEQVITRTVTYSNEGTTDVTLALTIEATGPNGTPTPAGMFSVSPATLTVPAGASAAATLTVDDRLPARFGLYTGRLFANADGRTMSIPLSIQRDAESYDLTIRHISRDGTPSQNYSTLLVPLFPFGGQSFPALTSHPGVPDAVTVRIPPGRYRVEARINPKSGTPPEQRAVTQFVKTLDVSADGNVTFDARTASAVTLRKPTQTARLAGQWIQWEYPLSTGSSRRVELSLSSETVYLDSGTQPQPGLTSWTIGQWIETAPPTVGADAPIYTGLWVDHDTLPTGPEKVLPIADAAVVDAAYVSGNPELTSTTLAVGPLVGSVLFNSVRYGALQAVSLPGHRTEYYYTNDEEISWSGILDIDDLRPEFPTTVVDLVSPLRRFQPRAHYQTAWNQPLHAPAFPATGAGLSAPVRRGDSLRLLAFLHSDRAGNLGSIGDDAPTGDAHQYRLYRNGELVLEQTGGQVVTQVPPESAAYRFEAEAAQTVHNLSSRVSAAWEFQSAHVQGDTPAALPLMTVRLYPDLNESGQALRGAPFAVPFVVNQVQPAAQTSAQCLADQVMTAVVTDLQPPEGGWPCPDNITNVTLEVSFDDGASWAAVPVTRFGRLWIAALKHPLTAEFVSLRSTARDREGNRVEQTVIRAYGLIDPPSLVDGSHGLRR